MSIEDESTSDQEDSTLLLQSNNNLRGYGAVELVIYGSELFQLLDKYCARP